MVGWLFPWFQKRSRIKIGPLFILFQNNFHTSNDPLICWTKSLSYPAPWLEVKKKIREYAAVSYYSTLPSIISWTTSWLFLCFNVTFKCLLRSLITRFSSLMSLVWVLIAIFLNKLFTPTKKIGNHKELTCVSSSWTGIFLTTAEAVLAF